jgi:hypothetical protein
MADDPTRSADGYEAYYAAKLWSLLPAIYRAEDAIDFDQRGPLEELVARVGAQAAVLRRSIDRLWEDQSIESCDDWVIAYLGDLVATNLVSSLDARGQRVDVAHTIRYRRRKGTVGLLEELATAITGWSARVVEMFRRMARTRHGLDPAIGLPVDPQSQDPSVKARLRLQLAEGLIGARTHTAAGGFADLRNVHGALLTSTAFDEYFHTADVRRGRGMTGWQDIPRLGVFVWRLQSRLQQKVTPVKDANGPCVQYTFDPTGRDVPLFVLVQQPFGEDWVSPQAQQMPGPMTADLLKVAFDDLYPRSVALWTTPAPYALATVAAAPDPDALPPLPWIDPERGRVIWPPGSVFSPFVVDYCAGFSSEIGAGSYDRPALDLLAEEPPLAVGHLSDPKNQVVTAPGTGAVVIDNSLTYDAIADVGPIVRVALRAENQQRPLIRPDLDVGGSGAVWTFTGTGDAELALDGLFISGRCQVVLAGSFAKVTLSCCTLDPGTWDAVAGTWQLAADGRELEATPLRITGSIRQLTIDRCITGPILVGTSALVETLEIRESIVQAADPSAQALVLPDGELSLSRSTLLGPAHVHRLEASECILHDVVEVADRQHGCVRFSAWAEGSHLPQRYESVMLPVRAPLFKSRDFGQPGYAQLGDTVGSEITEGAEDGSEMGAFWREKNAVKERSLLIKYQEYAPLGLEPFVVHVT